MRAPGTTDFVFDLHAPRRRLSHARVLQALRQFASDSRGRNLTTARFDRWRARPCSADTIRRHFGSWRDALSAAGLEAGRPWRYRPHELIDRLEKAWIADGFRPREADLFRRHRISEAPYRRLWGSLYRACELLADYHAGKITRQALLRPSPPPRRRRALPAGLRWTILQRDNFRCRACGRSPTSPLAGEVAPRSGAGEGSDAPVTLHVDHIRPVIAGGDDSPENLRTLCRDCNLGKGPRQAA